MKVVVTGAKGQLGTELLARPPLGWTVAGLSSADLDVSDPGAVETAVARLRPELIINASAYTAVDKAESESARAWSVNRDGAAALARAASAIGARMVHVSTDFVFDGRASRPYSPDAATGPLGVYGASKLAGEAAVAAVAPEALIVRTAWVYSPHGGNFVKTMLRLMATGNEVRVVADQIGTPTSAAGLAASLWALVQAGATGLHHVTDAGVASWYDFACAIGEEAHGAGLLAALPSIRPIATEDYPTPARRPAYGVLDKTSAWAILGRPAAHWRTALRPVIATLAKAA